MRYLLIVLLLAGCASGGPHDYSQSEARAVQTVQYGTVESVREVKIKGGRAAATIIGAVGGGMAGNAIERKMDEQDGQEIVIRLERG